MMKLPQRITKTELYMSYVLINETDGSKSSSANIVASLIVLFAKSDRIPPMRKCGIFQPEYEIDVDVLNILTGVN